MTTPDPDPTDVLCEDETCPAYGRPHGPDHDRIVDSAAPPPDDDLAELLRLHNAATRQPADLAEAEARDTAREALQDRLTRDLPDLVAELQALRSRIVTVDLDGRTVRYDRVAECDAALELTEQGRDQAERDRDAAQADAYRLLRQLRDLGDATDQFMAELLTNAGPGWADSDHASAAALRYVRHLEAIAAERTPTLTTAAVARLLGVSRPRVVQLRQAGGFPDPDALVDRRPRWHEATIRAWAARVGRTVPETHGATSCPTPPATDDRPTPQGGLTFGRAYRGTLQVYEPPDGDPYPYLRRADGSAIVFHPGVIVDVTDRPVDHVLQWDVTDSEVLGAVVACTRCPCPPGTGCDGQAVLHRPYRLPTGHQVDLHHDTDLWDQLEDRHAARAADSTPTP